MSNEGAMNRRELLRRGGLVVGAGVLGGGLLSACGSDEASSGASTGTSAATTAGGKPGEGKTIGLILIGVNEFVTGVATGVLNELEPAGYTVRMLSSNFTADDEIRNYQSFISQKVDGIITLPVTAASSGRGALLAQQQKIPVVDLAWAAGGPADDILAGRLQFNYRKETAQISSWLDENRDPSEVVVIQGAPGNPTSDTFDTVIEKIDALGNGWKVVGKTPGFYLRDRSIAAAENLFAAHPNARVVITAAAEMGVGVASFLQRNKMTDVTSITTDGNAEMVEWMDKGYVTATLYLSGATDGVMGGQLMRRHLEDGAPPTDVIDVPMSMETARTMRAKLEQEPMAFPRFLPTVQAAL